MDLRERIYSILENVSDPEIPVLSVLDLGIVRDVLVSDSEVEIVITPTYSGCPAMTVIATNIRMEMIVYGIEKVKITTVLSPAWTTDWMTESGKEKLKNYGIAPPQNRARLDKILFETPPSVPCPICNSMNTEQISEFGSTACKSLFKCLDCLEPFDYFKCH
jgi:ring-1,2-phenylacetyl-CoA epoxidase subunit PaaD